MPANEFEINMQRKMEELNLDPSADVWQEVQRRIRKEKKRRGMFFWLILGGLLLGGGTIALIVKNKDQKNEMIITQTKKQDDSNKEQQKINIENNNELNNTTATDPQTKDNKLENSLSDNNSKKTEQPSTPDLDVKVKEKVNVPLVTPTKKELVNKKKNTKEKQEVSSTKYEIFSSNKKPIDKPIEKTITETKPIQHADPAPDTVRTIAKNILPENDEKKNTSIPVTAPVVSIPASDTDSTKKKEKKSEKKKEWSFWVQAGVSGNVNGFRLFEKRDYLFAQGLGSLPGGGPATIQNPKPGPSFSTGMSLRLPIAPRLNFNAGFGYDYLSTRVMAGKLTDSMGTINNPGFADLTRTRFYPATGELSGISNNYHFLSFSADLSWRIFNKKNFSLYWDNGMSYKLLFASRVLHYNRGLKGYYVDPRLVTKHYAFVSTGLSIPISKKVTLQPFAGYSLTRVLKNHDTANVHFTNYGLRIKFSLGGKK